MASNLRQLEIFAAGLVDAYGAPMASGTVYFYEAGTNTPKNIYFDIDGASASTFLNLATQSSAGKAAIYGSGIYDIAFPNGTYFYSYNLQPDPFQTHTVDSSVTTSYTPDASYDMILIDASVNDVTINLGPVINYIKPIVFKKISPDGTVYIVPNGGETIEGSSGEELTAENSYFGIVPNNGAWYVYNGITNINASMMGDSSVTTTAIADNAVTHEKMADDSVGTEEIIDSSITHEKLAFTIMVDLNGSFDSPGSAGSNTVGSWTASAYAGGTVSRVTGTANTCHGVGAFAISEPTHSASGSGGGQIWNDDFWPCNENVKSAIAYYMKTSATDAALGTGGTAGSGMRVELLADFYDGSYNPITASTGVVLYSSRKHTPNTFVDHLVAFTPPVSARYYKFGFRGGPTTVTGVSGSTSTFDDVTNNIPYMRVRKQFPFDFEGNTAAVPANATGVTASTYTSVGVTMNAKPSVLGLAINMEMIGGISNTYPPVTANTCTATATIQCTGTGFLGITPHLLVSGTTCFVKYVFSGAAVGTSNSASADIGGTGAAWYGKPNSRGDYTITIA